MIEKLNASPIQRHIEIKEIKDDVLVLANNSLRAVLMTTSINFALKSKPEQDAIIYRFQDLLNSIDHDIQILVNSRKFEIKHYVAELQKKYDEQTNELLKLQTLEYIDFIKGLTEMSNIMTESFYIIIPYSPISAAKKGLLDFITGKKQENHEEKLRFTELKNNLWQRVEFIITGLQAIGIKAAPLKTQELIELFYKLYNPDAKEEPQEIDKAREMRLK